MQFHEKKIDLFDFTSFFASTFLNFLAHCVIRQEEEEDPEDYDYIDDEDE